MSAWWWRWRPKVRGRCRLLPCARVAIGITVVVVAIVTVIAAARNEPDRPQGDLAQRIFFPDDTAYAAGFSEHAFQQLQAGMTAGDVTARLGMPLKVVESTGLLPIREFAIVDGARVLVREMRTAPVERTIFYYSQPRNRSESFHARNVIFDENGRAIEIQARFRSD